MAISAAGALFRGDCLSRGAVPRGIAASSILLWRLDIMPMACGGPPKYLSGPRARRLAAARIFGASKLAPKTAWRVSLRSVLDLLYKQAVVVAKW